MGTIEPNMIAGECERTEFSASTSDCSADKADKLPAKADAPMSPMEFSDSSSACDSVSSSPTRATPDRVCMCIVP